MSKEDRKDQYLHKVDEVLVTDKNMGLCLYICGSNAETLFKCFKKAYSNVTCMYSEMKKSCLSV